jgi:Rad3-related DNA helicase
MVIEEENKEGEPPCRKLMVWSFNPSFTFKSLISEEQPRCVILTSGTLVPFETYESEFDMKFPVQVINDHVIDKQQQVFCAILPVDHQGFRLNFSYKKRDDSTFILHFAMVLQRIF